MIGQVFRWLIFTAFIAAVLVAVFVAWWLALLIALVALALAALRRLFGGKPAKRAPDDAVILEGEYTEVEREARDLPDRDRPAP
jgi:membrane protein implicated in regulation of membrane protease activity